jgi:hypothetical protein
LGKFCKKKLGKIHLDLLATLSLEKKEFAAFFCAWQLANGERQLAKKTFKKVW